MWGFPRWEIAKSGGQCTWKKINSSGGWLVRYQKWVRWGPKSRDIIWFQIRHVTRIPNLKSDSGLGLRFRSC